MADVRTYDPASGDGLQKFVREALGETVRPVRPGEETSQEGRDDASAFEPYDASGLPLTAGETVDFPW